ncbi:hypothetical protein Nocox_20460 [Nonomuraea coxensis DSM 45129]|uniref:Uncharacterized protein n=1 Tax=Nonomuraea coxensis DSM 45129 TaxID=1122611 RepID=A0ABX8U482_9ACTN|nr:hypothetical protein [Nonomuraea coxensis]QYC41701.1 hypothetical protein Nocox_20460 [Nonomuraea coxensis DSM 45129]
MDERPFAADDTVARSLYARIRQRGESLPEAAEQMRLAAADIDRARSQLVRLQLLNPETQTAADVTTALNRSLQSSHRLLDRLVEQHVKTASLAKHYLGLSGPADSHAHVKFFPGPTTASSCPSALTSWPNRLRLRALHAQIAMSNPLIREFTGE